MGSDREPRPPSAALTDVSDKQRHVVPASAAVAALALTVAAVIAAYARAPSSEQANPPSEQANPSSEHQGAKNVQQPASLGRVETWAGDGATVRPYQPLSVPGLEIFVVTTKPPEGVVVSDYTPPRRGVAVQGSAILEGQAAMEAATDAGVSEPAEIAKLSLLFLHDGGDLVTEGEGVAAPGYQGRALVYYWRASDMGRQLMKSQLNTASFEVTSEPVGAGASAGAATGLGATRK